MSLGPDHDGRGHRPRENPDLGTSASGTGDSASGAWAAAPPCQPTGSPTTAQHRGRIAGSKVALEADKMSLRPGPPRVEPHLGRDGAAGFPWLLVDAERFIRLGLASPAIPFRAFMARNKLLSPQTKAKLLGQPQRCPKIVANRCRETNYSSARPW